MARCLAGRRQSLLWRCKSHWGGETVYGSRTQKDRRASAAWDNSQLQCLVVFRDASTQKLTAGEGRVDSRFVARYETFVSRTASCWCCCRRRRGQEEQGGEDAHGGARGARVGCLGMRRVCCEIKKRVCDVKDPSLFTPSDLIEY